MTLELRNKRKLKKPGFVRADANKGKKFGSKWTKPRGLQNKLRLNKKGNPRSPSPGYGSPKLAKGLTRDGLKLVRVSKVDDLSGINTKNEAVLLVKGIGAKRKIEILERVKSSGVRVFNVKDVNSCLEKLKKSFDERKKAKKKKIEAKKAAEKKAADKKKSKDKEIEVKEEKKPEPKKVEKKGAKK